MSPIACRSVYNSRSDSDCCCDTFWEKPNNAAVKIASEKKTTSHASLEIDWLRQENPIE